MGRAGLLCLLLSVWSGNLTAGFTGQVGESREISTVESKYPSGNVRDIPSQGGMDRPGRKVDDEQFSEQLYDATGVYVSRDHSILSPVIFLARVLGGLVSSAVETSRIEESSPDIRTESEGVCETACYLGQSTVHTLIQVPLEVAVYMASAIQNDSLATDLAASSLVSQVREAIMEEKQLICGHCPVGAGGGGV